MLDVIFNDCISDLSLILINGDEGFAVLDSKFEIYATISTDGIDTDRSDLEHLRFEATDKYYENQAGFSFLDNDFWSSQKNKSIVNFSKWLDTHFKGDDYE